VALRGGSWVNRREDSSQNYQLLLKNSPLAHTPATPPLYYHHYRYLPWPHSWLKGVWQAAQEAPL